ncbi:MAG: 23S rRNA (adenine(2030)-N(6))-methyltransferase RlmJ [Alphaproteobacteria bacterium]
MNYLHLFHAGSFADVFKHAVFVLVLEHMKKKAAPFFVLDTHAGAGRYDLTSKAAARTGEAREGIGRILAAPGLAPALGPYVGAVRRLNARYGAGPRWYPGSPLLAAMLLRPGDRIALAELHPEEARALAREFGADPRVTVHHMDGYVALKALLPPPERRAVVLIDPPFEEPDEFERMAEGLRQACRRFATGVYLLWYPIKDADGTATFLAALRASGLARILMIELRVYPTENPERLNGCGMILVNPPWAVTRSLAALGPELVRLLAREGGGGWRLEWLAGE